MCHSLDAAVTGRMKCSSRLGMVQGSSQILRCLVPVPCKLSDPLKVIPDGLKEGGIQSTTSIHSPQIQLIAVALLPAPQKSTYMTGATQRVKKTLAPRGSIAFLYLNAKCYETKWLVSFSSNVNTFTKLFTCLLVPHTKQIALAMTERNHRFADF